MLALPNHADGADVPPPRTRPLIPRTAEVAPPKVLAVKAATDSSTFVVTAGACFVTFVVTAGACVRRVEFCYHTRVVLAFAVSAGACVVMTLFVSAGASC